MRFIDKKKFVDVQEQSLKWSGAMDGEENVKKKKCS